MALVVRIIVFGVCNQVELIPAGELNIILCKMRITMALIRLRGHAGWSAYLLFEYKKIWFSRNKIIAKCTGFTFCFAIVKLMLYVLLNIFQYVLFKIKDR